MWRPRWWPSWGERDHVTVHWRRWQPASLVSGRRDATLRGVCADQNGGRPGLSAQDDTGRDSQTALIPGQRPCMSNSMQARVLLPLGSTSMPPVCKHPSTCAGRTAACKQPHAGFPARLLTCLTRKLSAHPPSTSAGRTAMCSPPRRCPPAPLWAWCCRWVRCSHAGGWGTTCAAHQRWVGGCAVLRAEGCTLNTAGRWAG